MSANDIREELNDMEQYSDVDEAVSSCSSEEEIDDEEMDQETNLDAWNPEGQLFSFPFTKLGQINLGPAETPIEFFNILFNNTFLTNLVNSINEHGLRMLLEASSENSRALQWKETTVEEMKVFLGLLLHMGHIKVHRINDFWKTDILYNLTFKNFMSRDRFLIILSNFSFSDPNLSFGFNDQNRFVGPIINFFNNSMKDLIIPPKNLIVEKSVIPWGEHFGMREEVNGKIHKYGVKIHVLTDTNGITQKINVNSKKGFKLKLQRENKPDEIVKMLIKDNLNEGHSLYLNKFYTSVSLAEDLIAKKTYITGTLKANKKGNPFLTKSQLKEGSTFCMYNGNGVCVTNYQDKKQTLMISTEHSPEIIEYKNKHGHMSRKPKVVLEYNKYIRGCHRKYELLSYHPSYSKSTKWYKKILIHVIQIMILNAYLMYKQQRAPDMVFYDFRHDVVRNLLNIKAQKAVLEPLPTDQLNSNNRNLITLDALKTRGERVHVVEKLPKNKNGKSTRKDCRYCLEMKNKRKATVYSCTLCHRKPGLCLDCFPRYHHYV